MARITIINIKMQTLIKLEENKTWKINILSKEQKQIKSRIWPLEKWSKIIATEIGMMCS